MPIRCLHVLAGTCLKKNGHNVSHCDQYASRHTSDVQMQTNHLSHFLLTKEFFPLLNLKAEAVGEARIVNHSSVAAWMDAELLDGKYLSKMEVRFNTLIRICVRHICVYTCAYIFMRMDTHFTGNLGGDSGKGMFTTKNPKMKRYQQSKVRHMPVYTHTYTV